MKNTVLKFKKEQLSNTQVYDYFSRDVDLSDIKERFPEIAKYFKKVRLMDNETPEQVSNSTYSNADLWDFLTLTNNRDPLFGFPYDSDIVSNLAEDKLSKFLKEHPRINISQERKSELLQEFTDEIYSENEKNRVIEAVEPKNLSNVILVLRQAEVL